MGRHPMAALSLSTPIMEQEVADANKVATCTESKTCCRGSRPTSTSWDTHMLNQLRLWIDSIGPETAISTTERRYLRGLAASCVAMLKRLSAGSISQQDGHAGATLSNRPSPRPPWAGSC